jgi:hypothetical protein
MTSQHLRKFPSLEQLKTHEEHSLSFRAAAAMAS